ncbi:MAG: hypothetical protein IJ390_00155 [Lachnospiraceae bacterium]|nr:hypothetical protein [Lachnospiraceae bacterium]
MKKKYLILTMSVMLGMSVVGCGGAQTAQTQQVQENAVQERSGQRPEINTNMVRGEVTELTGESITIQDENGESQIIPIIAETTFTKMEVGKMADGGEKPADGEAPEKPDGEKPADGEAPERPDGEKPADGEAPEKPVDGEMPTEGGRRGGMPQGEEIAWSDIAVGDTVMIILTEDGNAESVSLMSGEMPVKE